MLFITPPAWLTPCILPSSEGRRRQREMRKKKNKNLILIIVASLLTLTLFSGLVYAAYLYGKKESGKTPAINQLEEKVQEAVKETSYETEKSYQPKEQTGPAYFRTKKEDWQRRVMRINFQDPWRRSTRNYFYSMLLPPDMTIKEEKDNEISYIVYRATDGYEYSIYPSDYLLNYLEDLAEKIVSLDDSKLRLGSYVWDQKAASLDDGGLIWYLSTDADGTEHGFTINIPQKDREKYIQVIKDIVGSFKFEQDCTKHRCND